MAAAVIVAALVIGVAIAVLAGGDEGDGDSAGITAPTIGELPTFEEGDGPLVEDDFEAPTVAPTNQLVEGEGEEFDTDQGRVRIVAARLEPLIPGPESPPPFGAEILSITFEPVDGTDPGPYAEAFQSETITPRLLLPDGSEAQLEVGGILHGELLVAFSFPFGPRSFEFEYPGNDPITLVIE